LCKDIVNIFDSGDVNRKLLRVCGLYIAVLIVCIFLVYVPVVAVEGTEENNVSFSIFSDRGETWIGDVIQMNIIVGNTAPTDDLIVKEIRLSLPEGWQAENQGIAFNPPMPINVPPNSSRLVQFNLTVYTMAKEGVNYTFTATAHTARASHDYFDVISWQLTTNRSPPSVLLDIDWNAIWILFLVYAIPGAAIERIVELFKWGTDRGRNRWWSPRWLPNFVENDAEIAAYKYEINNIRNDTPETQDTIIGKELANDEKLSSVWRKIRDLQAEVSRREIKVKAYTYMISFLFALIISAPLILMFNLGLLQLLLRLDGSGIEIADILLTSIIVAFVTKPTHDLISWIEKIRNVKVAAPA
jgi:hypothetical protein